MVQSVPPGPPGRPDDEQPDHGGLSAREQQELDRIAGALTDDDPGFARRMSHPGAPSSTMPPPRLILIARILVGLGFAVVVLPASGWVALGLLAVLVGLPLLILCVTEPHPEERKRREDRL